MTLWNLDPSVLGGIALAGVAYALQLSRRGATHRAGWRRPLAFAAGLATLALALATPLDFLADHVSLLAHMLQHLLLLLVAPVLFLAGAPEALLDECGSIARATLPRPLTHPIAILGLSLGIIWIWHAPALYEAALRAEPLHAGEHLCFLLAALLYWWPLLRPASCPWRLPDPLLIVYLFAAAVGGSMLAALITFSSDLLYPTYASPAAFADVRASLGFTPSVDQQLAGLLMWVGGGLWYFGAAIVVFARWFSEAAADDPIASPNGAPL